MAHKRCPICRREYITDDARCPIDRADLVVFQDPLIGTVLGGRYEIVSCVGVGGMGTVYRARHTVLGRELAVKVLSPQLTRDPVQRERFFREARATSMLHHENIVEVIDVGVEGPLTWLVMELLDGETLADRLNRGPLSLGEALDLLTPVVSALGRAHELEVVHRDIKPENVFLASIGGTTKVKVLDFGLVHVRGEARLTASGEVFGTPEYMSPEQSMGDRCGPPADLYAVGVMFYELLSGRLPFEGHLAELVVKHARDPAPSVRALMPEVPVEVDGLIRRLMEKDPARRYRDGNELLAEFGRLRSLLPRPSLDPSSEFEEITQRSQPLRHLSGERLATWRRRYNVFQAAVAAAYPRSPPPKWVHDALEELGTRLDDVRRREEAVQAVAREFIAWEEQANSTRTRIDRAVEELARDTAAAEKEAEALREARDAAHADLDARRETLLAAWRDATSKLGDPPALTESGAKALEAAGHGAGAWMSACAEVREQEGRSLANTRIREDLTFQVEKLAQRVSALDVEREQRHEAMENRMSELGGEIAALYRSIESLVEPMRTHLGEFPAARSLVAADGPMVPLAPVASRG